MKTLLYLIILCVSIIASNTSQATTLNFDDIYTSDNTPIPNGYGGFNWSNGYGDIYVITKTSIPNTGYYYGNVSNPNSAFNAFGDTPSYIDLAGTGTFDFNGAYWTSAWDDQNLSFEGWKNGDKLYTSGSYAINTQTPLWIALNWTGIDRLAINSANTQWVMDNFTFNEHANAVPVPAAVWLFGSALLGLAHIARRKSG